MAVTDGGKVTDKANRIDSKPYARNTRSVMMAFRESTDVQCVACQAVKPGATVKPKGSSTAVTSSSGGFSFSKPSALTKQPPPAYPLCKPAEKSETAEAPNPSFSFGQSAAGSSTAPAPFAAPNTFLFRQTAATFNDAPPAKAFVFAQRQDSQPSALSAAPLNSTPTPVPAQHFFFGAPASAAAAPAAPPAAAAPSFGFGAAAPTAASTTAPSAAPSPFAFSLPPPSGLGGSQTSAFGTSFGSLFPAAPSQPPAFGAKPNATPVFGQQTNATPVFGAAANSTQGGGFQFEGFNLTQPQSHSGSTRSLIAPAAVQPAIGRRTIKKAWRSRKSHAASTIKKT